MTKNKIKKYFAYFRLNKSNNFCIFKNLISRYCSSTGKHLPQLIFQKLIYNTLCLTCKQTHSGNAVNSSPYLMGSSKNSFFFNIF